MSCSSSVWEFSSVGLRFRGNFFLLDVVFLGLDLDMFVLDVESEAVIDAHVLVGHPDQAEEGEEVAAPVRVKELVSGDQ